MNKIKQLSFLLFIFSVLAFSYPVTQVFAQGGGQCDSNPACNPASVNCCGQCDSNPACNPNDPNGIPCCSLEGNNMTNGSKPHGGFEPPRHPGTPNDPPGSILLVKKLEKMSHELKECQSLTKELKSASQPAARSSQPPAQCAPDPGKVSLCAPHRIFPAQEELGLRQLLFNLGIMQRPETGLNMDKLLHIARMHREYCQQGD